MTISKVAVVGSGVMGAAIAAHIANSGTPVLLFDIVPKDAKDRNELAKKALESLKDRDPAPLVHRRKLKLMTACNLEDDLGKLKEVDWIIEAIIERKDIKQSLYKKLDEHRKPGSLVSSNTSTLPLKDLVEGMPERFRNDFLITHFFNPPRYMRLLELIPGSVDSARVEMIRNFCDVKLGKGVVDCKDTPGFIANRIGIFWLTAALMHALRQKVTVEEADAVMGKPVGIPKTGVFGLMDLIGIDLLPLIAKAFGETLPKDDTFLQMYKEPPLIMKMIADGYTGRKGKGGFYRINKEGGGKVKESINLQTGEYAVSGKAELASVSDAKQGLRALVSHQDKGGKYAWAVLRDVLHYTASLIPEISDDIRRVDDAMKMGYAWKYGPFELIDRLGDKTITGTKWFAEKLKEEGLSIPPVLAAANGQPFYKTEETKRLFLNRNGSYDAIPFNPDAWTMADIKPGKKPVLKNASASLWDVGDGIACFEFNSKMNSLDPFILELLAKSTEKVKSDFRGLIIGNDGDNFSVGANIGVLLFAANVAAWKEIDGIIKQGQDTFMGLKFAPFPVVGAPSGMALGGGCEMLMHCDAVNAHIEFYSGLVEVGVGFVPGWGGCKEMIVRAMKARAEEDSLSAKMGGMFSFISPLKSLNAMPALTPVFTNISTANVSKSAELAKDMLILNARSHITMNRARVLADAKKLCLELTHGYQPPVPATVSLPGKTARMAFDMGVKQFEKQGKVTPHDKVVSAAVGYVISGGNTDITKELNEQQLLDLEREKFMELVRNPNTMARIEHMLETGKPLRN